MDVPILQNPLESVDRKGTVIPRKKVTKDNRIQLPDGRYYESEGKKLPSVTTLLNIIAKPALVHWAAKIERELVFAASVEYYQELSGAGQESCQFYLQHLEQRVGKSRAHQRVLTEAGEIGNQAHARIEYELQTELGIQCEFDQPTITHLAAQQAYDAWKDWRAQTNMRPIAIEQVIVSDKHGYAGTLDLLAEVSGVLSVLDWKTGKAIYAEALLQNAAYRGAVREMGIGDPKQGFIIRLPKLVDDPGFEVRDAGDEDSNLKAFLATRDLWQWLKTAEKLLKKEKENDKKEAEEAQDENL